MPERDVVSYVRAFREYESATKHAEAVITEALRDAESRIASLNRFIEVLKDWKSGAVSGFLKPDSLDRNCPTRPNPLRQPLDRPPQHPASCTIAFVSEGTTEETSWELDTRRKGYLILCNPIHQTRYCWQIRHAAVGGAINLATRNHRLAALRNVFANKHVSQVVQGASAEAAAWGTLAAARAVPAGVVPTALHNLGLRQIFNVADAFRDIRHIFPWTYHGSPPDTTSVKRITWANRVPLLRRP